MVGVGLIAVGGRIFLNSSRHAFRHVYDFHSTHLPRRNYQTSIEILQNRNIFILKPTSAYQ